MGTGSCVTIAAIWCHVSQHANAKTVSAADCERGRQMKKGAPGNQEPPLL